VKKLVVIFSILFLIFCSEPRKGADWPTFRGSFHRTGYSPDSGPSDDPEIAWRIDLQSRVSSSPIIAEGRMYLGHHAGMVSVDPYSGEIHWRFPAEKKVFSTPTYHSGDIIFGCWDKHLYRLRGKNGDIVWAKVFTTVIDCSPVIFEDEIFVGDFGGSFSSVGFDDGEIRKAILTGDWIVGSAAFDGKTLYFGSRNSKFYALDKESFKMEWEFNAQGDISCTPAIDEERVYFGANNMKLFCLDRKIGKPIWEFETNGAMFSSPAIYNEKLFCGSTDSTIYCIYSGTGEEIWHYRTEGIIYSSAAVCGNRVYIGCHDGHIYALDTETGNLIWKEFLGSPITSSPAVYDDMLIVAGDNGVVLAFR